MSNVWFHLPLDVRCVLLDCARKPPLQLVLPLTGMPFLDPHKFSLHVVVGRFQLIKYNVSGTNKKLMQKSYSADHPDVFSNLNHSIWLEPLGSGC